MMSDRAFGIEQKSFEIIDEEAGKHGYGELEWPIVRRIIHATADFDFAGKGRILFHNNAIESAFSAIRDKCTIVTDVDMVRAAINKTSLSKLGLKTSCYISDPKVAELAQTTGMTRSEAAMQHGVNEINGGIVAVGNAPTALFHILKMVQEGACCPSLVVGLPVGFVSAAESKEALAQSNIPYVTNVGRKGGSPATSAAVNAILLMFQSIHERE